MPKIRTNRGAAKRFKVTAKGKVRKNNANKSHLLTHKSRKRKRRLRKAVGVDSTNVKAIKKLIPYL